MKSIIAILSFLTLAPPSLGAWASGGGEILGNSLNPWFLANTPVVDACLEIDEANFGVDRETADRVVRSALDYWKTEFRAALPGSAEVQVATQTFRFGPCTDETALRIQLGVLSEGQRAEFRRFDKRPQDFVGITVRTEYDELNRRGKGFIYISPESGPERFALPNALLHPWSLRENPEWARKFGLFHKVLVHELGHVFGVGHRPQPFNQNFGWYSVMDERMPEQIVIRAPEFAWDMDWIPGFFSERAYFGLEIYKPQAGLRSLFGVTGRPEWLRLVYGSEQTEVLFEGPEHEEVRAGSISHLHASARPDPVVRVKTAEADLQGPGFAILRVRGVFTDAGTGETREVSYSYNPVNREFTIAGVKDGLLITELD